jgi:hypothetical protein
MSSISGVGGPSLVEPSYVPPRASAPSSASGEDPLVKLQSLMKQIEGAANTKAIPAHQSW